MPDETFIKLTDEQKEQMKKATGQEHEEIKVETVGAALTPRVAPRLRGKQALKKHAMKKQALKKHAMKKQALKKHAMKKQALKKHAMKKQALKKHAMKKQALKK